MRGVEHQRGAARRPFLFGLCLLGLALVAPADAAVHTIPGGRGPTPPPAASGTLRIATWNVSFFRKTAGDLERELASPGSSQPQRIAAVLQRVRPDLLLLNEFDHDPRTPGLFVRNYLALPQDGGLPLSFGHHFTAPVNTGVPSGLDLDRDGKVGGGGDALGFGQFPGQYGLVVFSRLPLDLVVTRTFRSFLWREMPDALLPPGWYSPQALAKLPLSSKSHWDVAVRLPAAGSVQSKTLHFLVSHPTPPAFDGPEDRNGRRNHDEIRLWADYIDPLRGRYLTDDAGRRGGLAANASFVIAGDMNADPLDGGSVSGAVDQLLRHPRVHREAASGRLAPRSAGAAEAAARQGGANRNQRSDPTLDTADFSDNDKSVGNLRADYLLPSADLEVCASGVFWPQANDAEFALVNDDVDATSDHRLVWIDIALPGHRCSRSVSAAD
jgi:hypothetical protein